MQGIKINIIDTPGHADFGGEVERVLNMCDGELVQHTANNATDCKQCFRIDSLKTRVKQLGICGAVALFMHSW